MTFSLRFVNGSRRPAETLTSALRLAEYSVRDTQEPVIVEHEDGRKLIGVWWEHGWNRVRHTFDRQAIEDIDSTKAKPILDPMGNRQPRRSGNPAMGKMTLGPAAPRPSLTDQLRRAKLKARSAGDLSGAMISAGYYARKTGSPMWVYEGNSYMHAVWRVTAKESDVLSPINNTGNLVFRVAPDLEVVAYDVVRPWRSGNAVLPPGVALAPDVVVEEGAERAMPGLTRAIERAGSRAVVIADPVPASLWGHARGAETVDLRARYRHVPHFEAMLDEYQDLRIPHVVRVRYVAIAELPKEAIPVHSAEDSYRQQAFVQELVQRMRAGEDMPPVLLDQGKIHDGRHRVSAARKLGMTHAPVVEIGCFWGGRDAPAASTALARAPNPRAAREQEPDDEIPTMPGRPAQEYIRRARAAGARGRLTYAGMGMTAVVLVDERGRAFKIARQDQAGPILEEEAEWLKTASKVPEMRPVVAKFYRWHPELMVIEREGVEGRPGGWMDERALHEIHERLGQVMAPHGWAMPEFKGNSYILSDRGPVLVDAGFAIRVGKGLQKYIEDVLAGKIQPREDRESLAWAARMEAGKTLDPAVAARLSDRLLAGA